jgi:hypothetical protein
MPRTAVISVHKTRFSARKAGSFQFVVEATDWAGH